MRRIVFLALLAVAACDNISFGNGGKKDDWSRIDESILTTSSGEVQLADGRRLPFSISSERYRAWDAAQSALDRGTAERFGDLLESANPSEASIQRSIDFLESDRDAREAIERAGMSVRDFVMTTVALEQEMRLATGQGRTPRMPPIVMPQLDTYPAQMYPVDTFQTYQPLPPPTYTPYPPVTTFDPRDTMTRVLPPTRVDTLYPTPATTDPNAPPPPTPAPIPVTRQPPQPVPVTPAPSPTPPRDTTRAPPRRDTQPAPVYPAPLPPPRDTSSRPRPGSPPDTSTAQPDSARRR